MPGVDELCQICWRAYIAKLTTAALARISARNIVRGEELACVTNTVANLVLLMFGVSVLGGGVALVVFGHGVIGTLVGIASVPLIWMSGGRERLLLTSEGIYRLFRERYFGGEVVLSSLPIGALDGVSYAVEIRSDQGSSYNVHVLQIRDHEGSGFRFEAQALLTSQIQQLADALVARGIKFEQEPG